MYREMDENNAYQVEISDENENQLAGNNSSDRRETGDQSKSNIKKGDDAARTTSNDSKYLDQLLRLQAEFANYKKRVEKERLELSDLFKSELVSSLLPVLDDFDRMLDHASDEGNEFLNGVNLIYNKFLEVLKGHGLNPVEAVGKKFDPSLHEAVLIDTGTNGEDDIVTEEWRKGYLFNDRLLRPAQVKVLKTEKVDEN